MMDRIATVTDTTTAVARPVDFLKIFVCSSIIISVENSRRWRTRGKGLHLVSSLSVPPGQPASYTSVVWP